MSELDIDIALELLGTQRGCARTMVLEVLEVLSER